ncbi:putative TPR-like protein [Ordospora pajunii]|uniref:putative TPR-like protein n=1 Tax=Ordospora pajunii TaxID=3039483 RepID=UPI0029526A9C|nr:putative TPR-like protein [Ordospora pajunii]KAH9410595.1 putative TPR-like protein [Ordospora pajunii]
MKLAIKSCNMHAHVFGIAYMQSQRYAKVNVWVNFGSLGTLMDIYELVRNNEHEQICAVEHPGLAHFRAVACIFLGRYEEALRHAEKNSFEAAYALYKLKKYKKALRILKGIDGEGSRVLSSQCMFFLGYYGSAYKMLSKIKMDDDVAVNLQAMKSMAILASKNMYEYGNRFQVRKMDDVDGFGDLQGYGMKSAEGRVDLVFNESFEYLFDERRFVEFLAMQAGKAEMKGTIVEEQLKNVRGQEVCMPVLSKSQKETVEYNKGVIDAISVPMHFQKNFARCDGLEKKRKSNECTWIDMVYSKDVKGEYRMNEDVSIAKIPVFSAKMALLRILVMWKNKKSNRRMVSEMKRLPEEIAGKYLSVFEPGKVIDKNTYARISKELMN